MFALSLAFLSSARRDGVLCAWAGKDVEGDPIQCEWAGAEYGSLEARVEKKLAGEVGGEKSGSAGASVGVAGADVLCRVLLFEGWLVCTLLSVRDTLSTMPSGITFQTPQSDSHRPRASTHAESRRAWCKSPPPGNRERRDACGVFRTCLFIISCCC